MKIKRSFCTKHDKIFTSLIVLLFTSVVLSLQVAFAGDTDAVAGIAQLAQSRDALYGIGIGAGMGYSFALKTIVSSLKSRIDVLEKEHDSKISKLEAKLARFEELSSAALKEKLSHG